jgi:hypothetical protein
MRDSARYVKIVEAMGVPPIGAGPRRPDSTRT